jgi:hypothetical protein
MLDLKRPGHQFDINKLACFTTKFFKLCMEGAEARASLNKLEIIRQGQMSFATMKHTSLLWVPKSFMTFAIV